IVMSSQGAESGSINIYSGSADISSQPAGTTMRAKAVITGNAKLYALGLTWSDFDIRHTTGSNFYSSTDNSLTTGNYLNINHARNTNDLITTGWVYDSGTSKWEEISPGIEEYTDITLDFDEVDESNYSQEDLAYSTTLTPSAVSGSAITLTLGTGNWNANSKIQAGCRIVNKADGEAGEADINAAPAGQTITTASTTVAFTNTDAIASGDWKIYCTDFNSGQVELNEAAVPVVVATGGTITYSGGYTIHTFLSSETFTPNTSMNVEYLVVAGGGSGGNSVGGGGGAGGFRTGTGHAVSAGDYSITVGAGGASKGPDQGIGNSGGNSVFDTITSIGGGYGGKQNVAGGSGGSGGGAGTITAGGAGTVGQGYDGGDGGVNGGNYNAGGGGGASEVGVNGNSALEYGGDGGDGTASSISGSSVTYAGGGGGGTSGGNTRSSGGAGGGGYGAAGTEDGGAGDTNTGSGGGGTGNQTVYSGAGGSGIVIIRYLTSYANAYPTSQYYIVNTTDTNQLNTTNWTDIDSGAITETLNSQTAHYSVSFDDRTTWKVFGSGESTWRSIAKLDSGTWKYNSNATYGSETWTSASTNSQEGALDQAFGVSANQMTGTHFNAISDANWEATGGWSSSVNTLDFAVGLKTASIDATPQLSQITMNYSQGDFYVEAYDANNVRLYNQSGSTANVRLDVMVEGSTNLGTVSLSPSAADVDVDSYPSIWINDTGGGNLIQLQAGSTD
ncbi:MAG: hypothetical protein JRD89_19265, partial [Deltaproteobacteria bacterium]|nr:hypothetical protein [Deltaproteobacteria bacterium]